MLKHLKKGVAVLLAAFNIVAFHSAAFAARVDMNLVYDGVSHKYSQEEIKITLNGNQITNFVVPPVSIDGRTLVPARSVFESMGAEVVWNADTKEVYVMRNNDLVVLQINNVTGTKNGTNFTMDVAPKIVNDYTMIPVRFVAEALDCYVGWDDPSRTVIINEDGKAPAEETPNLPSNPSGGGTQTPSGSEITVNSVTVPDSSAGSFVIHATGEIEKFETIAVSDNRLAVDIYYANMGISNTNITVENNAYVSGIRSAQNQVTPVKITRVVFDLKTSSGYNAVLGSDKKSVQISFEKNTVYNLSAEGGSKVDTVKITGTTVPSMNISTSTSPNSIVIDIPNSESNLVSEYAASGLNFIKSIKTSQPQANTTRVILEIPDNMEYETAEEGTSAVIRVYKSTLENMSYDTQNRTLTLKKEKGLAINSVIHNDNYLNKQYTLTLPGDYSDVYGYGYLKINDAYVSTVEVKNSSTGNTEFTFNENQICVLKVSEDSNNIYIQILNPKEVYNKVVVIDAGHGGTDPGTNGNGLVEKDVSLDIMLRVYSLLEANPDIKVYATRLTDTYPTNQSRIDMANLSADLFVSIHQNAATNNPVPNGTETLYKPVNGSGQLTNKIAAQFMQTNIINAIGTTDRGIKVRDDLLVLNQAKVTAVLIECGFLTNAEDASRLAQDEVRAKYADAIYTSIVQMLSQYSTR